MMKRRISVFSGLLFIVLWLSFPAGAVADSYLVKKGDSLYTISKQFGVSVDEIKTINHLSGNNLKPGQSLEINANAPAVLAPVKAKGKPASFYTVKKGDTLSIIARKTGVPMKQIAALNQVNSKNLRIGRHLTLAKSAPLAPLPAADDEEDDLEGEDDDETASSNPASGILCDTHTSDEFMGKWGSADERKLFIRVATGFMGAPYRLGGATVKGIDCSAFVRKMYEFFDISLPRTAREQSAVGVRIERGKLVEGDLVFFRTRKPVGHVGIYIGNNEFVHASYKSKAVRIDKLDQPYFQKRFLHAVRVKDLDPNDGT